MTRSPLAVPLLALLLGACATSTPRDDATKHALRVDYRADRWFVEATTVDGRPMRFFTDTGGGFLVHEDSAARLGLAVRTVGEGDESGRVAPFPVFAPGDALPAPLLETELYVVARTPQTDDFGDGMLGQEWFGGRVWTFDYPARTLAWRDSAEGLRFDPASTVALGFPVGEDGSRSTNFPSIDAEIDGETLPFLFDTGATLTLTDAAWQALGGGGAKVRATSFVVASVFDRWRASHPDWRVVEDAEDNRGAAPIIEVPAVTIAGFTVGPVWFTRRPDAAFHEYMSQWMDRRVEGALGGNAFRWFRIVVDYPGARAAFALP
jgi:hypothetical protein